VRKSRSPAADLHARTKYSILAQPTPRETESEWVLDRREEKVTADGRGPAKVPSSSLARGVLRRNVRSASYSAASSASVQLLAVAAVFGRGVRCSVPQCARLPQFFLKKKISTHSCSRRKRCCCLVGGRYRSTLLLQGVVAGVLIAAKINFKLLQGGCCGGGVSVALEFSILRT
jgi:hypothetical protein